MEASNRSQQARHRPPGFLHGFCTLTDDVELVYKVTDYYSPAHDACVRFDDPAIGVPWPVAAKDATLSDRDRAAPLLADCLANGPA